MFLMALFVFQVPLKGSFFALLLGVVIYVTTTTAYGMLISSFASTQIAALFGTAILTVSAGVAVLRPCRCRFPRSRRWRKSWGGRSR